MLILGSFWIVFFKTVLIIFGNMFVYFWDHFVIILGSFWNHFGIVFGQFLNIFIFLKVLGMVREQFWDTL